MSGGFELPEVPDIDEAYRGAYRSLARIALRSPEAEQDLTTSEVVEKLRRVTQEAELAVAARLGPLAH